MATAPDRAATGTFLARCPHCSYELDLVTTPWCGCSSGHPSRICPTCWMCACSHFNYGNPLCWEPAPEVLKKLGFAKFYSPYAHRGG